MSKIYKFLDAESAMISIENTVNYCDWHKCNECELKDFCYELFKKHSPRYELYKLADKCRQLNRQRGSI